MRKGRSQKSQALYRWHSVLKWTQHTVLPMKFLYLSQIDGLPTTLSLLRCMRLEDNKLNWLEGATLFLIFLVENFPRGNMS